MMHHHKILGV